MQDDATGQKAFVAQCKNGLCAGNYAIAGRKLTLTSEFGSQSTILGLQKSEKLARKMLKRVCDTLSTGAGDPRLLKSRPRVNMRPRVLETLSETVSPEESPPTIVDGPQFGEGRRVSA